MKTRDGNRIAFLLVGGFVLFGAQSAQATAIATSDITASNLIISPAEGTLVLDPFNFFAFAQAQNSLGEDDPEFDFSNPAVASALVTWADAQATIGDATPGSAASNVDIPGSAEGSANAKGYATFDTTFSITCPDGVGNCGSNTTLVGFSVDLSGQLDVFTDFYGALATTETIFNLNVVGEPNAEPLLFDNRILTIGPSDVQTQSFAYTATGTIPLLFDTSYSLFGRVDSESQAINTPEPASLTLLGLGLAAALRFRRRRAVVAAARPGDSQNPSR